MGMYINPAAPLQLTRDDPELQSMINAINQRIQRMPQKEAEPMSTHHVSAHERLIRAASDAEQASQAARHTLESFEMIAAERDELDQLRHEFAAKGEAVTMQRDELMANIETAISRMVRMLDDVLLLGRVDAGRLVFRPAPVDLVALCRQVVDETRRTATPADKPDLAVELTTRGACGRPILDENLLRHILSNLLSNALKYSPDGTRVRVEVACDPRQIVLSVADKGIGIAPEDLSHVFQAFYRASNVGNIAGTGLGLAIVKAAVTLHGGSVEVQSTLGAGTRFTVTLPRAASEP